MQLNSNNDEGQCHNLNNTIHTYIVRPNKRKFSLTSTVLYKSRTHSLDEVFV